MARKPIVTATEVRAAAKLTTEGIHAVLSIVESMHSAISPAARLKRTLGIQETGISGFIYRIISLFTSAAGSGVDRILAKLETELPQELAHSPQKELVLAILNGVSGDYLEKHHSALAIPMSFRRNGLSASPETWIPKEAPQDAPLLLLLHGLCMNDLLWARDGYEIGERLSGELNWPRIYLRYNSGRHISENGRELALKLHKAWEKVPQKRRIVILAHSMGGLVARSAVYYAQQKGYGWVNQVDRIVFLGTPHHGAPLERFGNVFEHALNVHDFTAPLHSLGKIRSAGITDLRYGNCVDEDWNRNDRFDLAGDIRKAVPKPDSIRFYAIAASLQQKETPLSSVLPADGLVPVESALGISEQPDRHLGIPLQNQHVFYETGHFDLIYSPKVFEQILAFMTAR